MLINSKSILAFFYPNIATQPIFTNIVKGEGRKPNLFEFYAKPHPIFYKYSERLILDRRTEEQNFSRLSILKSVLVFFCQNIMKHVSDIFIPSRSLYSINLSKKGPKHEMDSYFLPFPLIRNWYYAQKPTYSYFRFSTGDV